MAAAALAMTPVQPADALLLQLYGCCTHAPRWHGVLDLLCHELGARSAVVQGLRLQGEQVVPYWVAHDSRTDLQAYNTFISDARNPRLQGKRLPSAVGQIARDDDLFSDEERGLQQRFQQQLLQLGLGRFLGGLLPVGEGHFMAIALHRDGADTGDYSARQQDRLAAVLPHFAQAMMLSQAVQPTPWAHSLLVRHLAHWACGLVVCSPDGRVHWLNQRAQDQLQADGGLQLQGGRLCTHPPQAQQRLLALLQSQPGRATPGYLGLNLGGQPCHLAVQTLQPEGPGPDEPALLLTLTSPRAPDRIAPDALVALFQLTLAEARLASALVGGDSLDDYAQRRGVAVGTVRYQLKQVLAKTGASRQADLVRLVLCSAAACAANAVPH